MEWRNAIPVSMIVLAVLFSVIVLQAQEHSAGQHGTHGAASSSMSEAIFCPAKSTGQLCNHGTADVLKLSGAKRDKWTEAANRYNRAVDAATKQLLEEAKSELCPRSSPWWKCGFAKA